MRRVVITGSPPPTAEGLWSPGGGRSDGSRPWSRCVSLAWSRPSGFPVVPGRRDRLILPGSLPPRAARASGPSRRLGARRDSTSAAITEDHPPEAGRYQEQHPPTNLDEHERRRGRLKVLVPPALGDEPHRVRREDGE